MLGQEAGIVLSTFIKESPGFHQVPSDFFPIHHSSPQISSFTASWGADLYAFFEVSEPRSLATPCLYISSLLGNQVCFLLCLLTLHSRISCCSVKTSGGLLAAQNSVCCSPLQSQKQQGVLVAGNQLTFTRLFKRQY